MPSAQRRCSKPWARVQRAGWVWSPGRRCLGNTPISPGPTQVSESQAAVQNRSENSCPDSRSVYAVVPGPFSFQEEEHGAGHQRTWVRISQSHFQPCGLGQRTREGGVDNASTLHLMSVWRLRWRSPGVTCT